MSGDRARQTYAYWSPTFGLRRLSPRLMHRLVNAELARDGCHGLTRGHATRDLRPLVQRQLAKVVRVVAGPAQRDVVRVNIRSIGAVDRGPLVAPFARLVQAAALTSGSLCRSAR